MRKLEEKKEGDSSFGQAVRVTNTVKTVMAKGKDPYVLKATERAKDRLRSRLLEITSN
ncbi:MAG: hypothetical protein GX081_09450 [Firmicutes bacterium]|nr:hypothetical protein [Bacillota bacterium]